MLLANTKVFTFLLAVLACYRLARLIAFEDGPGDIFHTIRSKAGAYVYDVHGRQATGIGRLLSCPYCVGFWLAIPLAFVGGIGWHTFLWWLAIAGGQAFLQAIGGNNE